MVLGIARVRPRLDIGPAQARATVRAAERRTWQAERGAIRLEAACDVCGGFPGFAQQGGRLENARLRVSDTYLLVDEGRPRGFGLPIRWLDGAQVTPQPGSIEPGLRILYRDGAHLRLFTLRLRGWLAGRGGRRVERIREELVAAGLTDRMGDRPAAEPRFVVPWGETADFEGENVIWAGRATAPLRIGEAGAPAGVWLTTRSLIWGGGPDGINRLPLALLHDVATSQVDDRAGTPAVYLGCGDDSTGRFDLAFLFDRQTPAERNLRERGAFLVGLRSRGVPLGAPAPLIQPWRINLEPWATTAPPAEPEITRSAPPFPRPRQRLGQSVSGGRSSVGPEVPPAPAPSPEPPRRRIRARGGSGSGEATPDPIGVTPLTRWSLYAEATLADPAGGAPSPSAEDGPAGDLPHEESAAPPAEHADVVLAEWSTGEPTAGGAADAAPLVDLPVAAGWIAEQAVATDSPLIESAEPLSIRPEAERSGTRAGASPAAKAYEVAAFAAVTSLLGTIDERVAGGAGQVTADMPPASLQAAAHAELADRAREGILTSDELRARQARLAALADAAARLRACLELHAAGRFSAADLARRRAVIAAQLSDVIFSRGEGNGDA